MNQSSPIFTSAEDASLERANSQSIADIVGRLEDKREKESSALRFCLLVDDLVQQWQKEKQRNHPIRTMHPEQSHRKAGPKSGLSVQATKGA
jgi:hypothetical protein